MRSTPFENGAISCEMPVVTKVAVFRSIRTERRVMVIVDNAKYHQPRMHRDWQQAQADHFALDFLPPYSPDLNPIEKAWAKLKQLLRAAKARSKETLDQAITEALPHITPDNARAWFRLVINGLQ